jgi:hypothetical protein
MGVRIEYRESRGSAKRTFSSQPSEAAAMGSDERSLESAVRSADLFSDHLLPHIAPADTSWYELHVELDGRVADWRLNDAQAWPALRPLLDYLHERATSAG